MGDWQKVDAAEIADVLSAYYFDETFRLGIKDGVLYVVLSNMELDSSIQVIEASLALKDMPAYIGALEPSGDAYVWMEEESFKEEAARSDAGKPAASEAAGSDKPLEPEISIINIKIEKPEEPPARLPDRPPVIQPGPTLVPPPLPGHLARPSLETREVPVPAAVKATKHTSKDLKYENELLKEQLNELRKAAEQARSETESEMSYLVDEVKKTKQENTALDERLMNVQREMEMLNRFVETVYHQLGGDVEDLPPDTDSRIRRITDFLENE